MNLLQWEFIRSHKQQLYVHTFKEIFTELTSTFCFVNKVRQKMPEKMDVITGDKPECKKSIVRSEWWGPPQLAIKMS